MDERLFAPSRNDAAYFMEEAEKLTSLDSFVYWVRQGHHGIPPEAVVRLVTSFPYSIALLPLPHISKEVAAAAIAADVTVAVALRRRCRSLVTREQYRNGKQRLAAKGGKTGKEPAVPVSSDSSDAESDAESDAAKRPSGAPPRERARGMDPYGGWTFKAVPAAVAAANAARFNKHKKALAAISAECKRLFNVYLMSKDPQALGAQQVAQRRFDKMKSMVTDEVRESLERMIEMDGAPEEGEEFVGVTAHVVLMQAGAEYRTDGAVVAALPAVQFAHHVATAACDLYSCKSWFQGVGRIVFGGEEAHVEAAIQFTATMLNEAVRSPRCIHNDYLRGYAEEVRQFFTAIARTKREVAAARALVAYTERETRMIQVAERMEPKGMSKPQVAHVPVTNIDAYLDGQAEGGEQARKRRKP